MHNTQTQRIRRALISVSDKSGLLEFVKVLKALQVELIATGGTAAFLQQRGFEVQTVEAITGFPEILGGRVKTLHPKIMGGILANRGSEAQRDEAHKHGVPLIDLVVVNLYPFQQVIGKPGATLDEAIENIDIGGVTLIRAAAKNFQSTAAVTTPRQYGPLIAELQQSGGLALATRQQLAVAAFGLTAGYDALIQSYLAGTAAGESFPELITFAFEKQQALRYGENPHQRAAFYRDLGQRATGLAGAEQLQGRELSYNNLADADTARNLAASFDHVCCVIVKHANPCGVAVASSTSKAYRAALATDPVSAFGGIIAFNAKVDEETASAVSEQFVEIIIAPAFDDEALALFTRKRNLRLLRMAAAPPAALADLQLLRVSGGVLIQERDVAGDDEGEFRVVTSRQPSDAEWAAMRFGWRVARWVKSNAVVFCAADRTLGIGAGQMSRVDASFLAIEKAKRAGLALPGCAVASDAFFPFADGIEMAAAAGATAVIQPGGSVRDAEVIAAADDHGMAMVFTGRRHFRH